MAEEKKYSDHEIDNINQDWGRDEDDTQKRPYSGQAVQNFIKKELNELNDNKVGGAYFKDGRLQLLDSEDGEVITSVAFTSTIYSISLVTETPNPLYVLDTSKDYYIEIAPSTESGTIGGDMNAYEEDYEWSVSIDTKEGYVEKQSGICMNGRSFRVNIRPWLITGANKVRFSVKGTDSGQAAMKIFSVTLTSLSLSADNVSWHEAYIKGNEYSFGAFSITGTLDKSVNIIVTNDDGTYRKDYTDNVGARTFQSNYFFRGIEFPTTGTGVYNVEIYVRGGSIESEHFTYRIMCVNSTDISTAKLICVNDFAENIPNYTSSTLLMFATYDGGNPLSEPSFAISAYYDRANHVIDGGTYADVATGIKQPFTRAIEIEASDDNFDLSVTMTNGNTEAHTFVIKNEKSFQATKGATFYMNAANRSNSQANREKVVNEADVNRSEYTMTTEKVAYVDGMDGWTTDDEGRSCLVVKAGARATINYRPLQNITNGAKSIEIVYKVRNVADYSDNVISIANNADNPRFVGLRVRPNEICLHSSSLLSEDNDGDQNYKTNEEEVIQMVMVLANNYRTNYGNMAQIYINGSIKRNFSANANDFRVDAPIVIGSDSADVYVYAIRVYNQALMFTDVHDNYIASIQGLENKQEEKDKNESVLNDYNEISFDKVKDSANYFVVEMTDGKQFPNYQTWAKSDSGHGNVEMHFFGHRDWDWKIDNVEVSGQGTTSMSYFRWNFRSRIDKSEKNVKTRVVHYWDESKNDWDTGKDSKTVRFDGNNHVPVIRITGKINYASSTQSHKMGATDAFNDLHDAVVGQNEAKARTAVFQHPAYGFVKKLKEGTTDEYTYEFIGLYTIGADKGDKPTFGYKDFEDTLISMEGTDHSPVMVMFKYPWNSQVTYTDECLSINKGDGTFEKAWEVGNCLGDETAGTAADDAKIFTDLEANFKGAYLVAYNNSTFIKHESDIAAINRNVNAYRGKDGKYEADNNRPNSNYELFDDNYDLWYFNIVTNKYEKTGLNVKTDLGVTDSELTGLDWRDKELLLREKRRRRFMADAPTYWNIEDSVFCHVFLTFFGATDNHGKNSYPYRLTEADKWRWRQDDLDTIFDIDNFGRSSKKYSVEFKDFTDENQSAYVFKGEESVFWTLIEECYGTDEYGNNLIRTTGRAILAAMESLSPVKDGNTMDRLMGFFYGYFWSRAQEYFPKSAYDCDSRYKYEEASRFFHKGGVGSYDADTDPLSQALGNHYEAELIWVERRLIYCMSKYRYGAFVNYEDTSLGLIAFRINGSHDFKIRPSMDLYPTMLVGQSGVNQGVRTMEGEDCYLLGLSGQNTNVYYMASDYLYDIGDLSRVPVDTQNSELSVSAKRIESLKLGDANASQPITGFTRIPVITCPSLLTFDARNLISLSGELDLRSCERIREVYLGGTQITKVLLPSGSKITDLQLSSYTSALELNNLKYLEHLDISQCKASITSINISACDSINAFEILRDVWNTQGNVLKDVRITDVDVKASNDIAEMLYAIANGKNHLGQDVVLNGISASGDIIEGKPYIQGHIEFDVIMGGYFDALKVAFPNLEITSRNITYPTEQELGLVLSGIANNDTIYEDNLRLVRLSMSANKEEYKQVNWVISPSDLPDGVRVDYTNSTAEIDLRGFTPRVENTDYTIMFNVVATSKWNERVSRSLTFFLSGRALAEVRVNVDNESANIGGYMMFSKVYNPTNTTKKSFTYYEVLNEDGSKNEAALTFFGDEAKVNIGSYTILDVVARFSLDEKIFGTKRIYLNDLLVLTDNRLAFKPLLSYIKNTLKVSESENVLYAKEAAKVTTLGGKLSGATEPFTFDEFEYFVSVKSLAANEFSGCTLMSSIKIPKNITSIGGKAFYNTTNLRVDLSFPNVSTLSLDDYFDSWSIFAASGITRLDLPNLETIIDVRSSGASNVSTPNNSGLCANCKNLEYVNLGKANMITSTFFQGCTSLARIDGLENVELLGVNVFWQTTSLVQEMNFPNLTTLGRMSYSYTFKLFIDSGITGFIAPKLTSFPSGDSIFHFFNNCPNLARVDIRSCASIGNYVFYQMVNPFTIRMDAVETIGTYAFMDDNIMIDGTLDNLKTINGHAFRGCTINNEDLRFPNLETIGDGCFHQSVFTKISDLGKIESIPEGNSNYGAFQKITNECEVVLPSTLKTVGQYSFADSNGIKISGFDSIENIGAWAFKNCVGIGETLSLPNLKSIGVGAFSGCNIKHVTSLGSITSITMENVNNSMFGRGIESVVFPNTLEKIGVYTFYLCNKLAIADIPQSVKIIGAAAFQECVMLGGIIDLPNLESLGTSAFYKTSIEGVQNLGIIETIIDGSNGRGVFSHNPSLEYVNLPNTLTYIGNNTFVSCTNLKRIVVPSSVTKLGISVFNNCSSLEFADISENVTSIGGSLFNGCSKLKTLILRMPTPTAWASSTLAGTPSTMSIYVPDESVDAYKNASGWSGYASRFKPISQYVE